MAPCSGYRVAYEHGAPASGGSPDAAWADPVASVGEPEGVTAAWGGHLHGNGMVWMARGCSDRIGDHLGDSRFDLGRRGSIPDSG